MLPTLVAIAGPLNGTTVELDAPEVCIGREPDNQVFVQSASVSRHHCALRRDGDSVVVEDLESRNGTFVNGISVSRHQLKHGDLLTIGDCSFRFVCQAETPAAQSAPVELNETGTTLLGPLWLSSTDVVYPGPNAATGGGADARALRDLSALLTMASKTASV